MVKGVSKTIIEVNNTGSEIFEKIVFYVTPQYSKINAKQLKKAAAQFSFNYSISKKKKTLRKKYKQKRIIKLSLISFALLSLIGIVISVVL